MVDQKEEAKKEKFIETMPTMIQTHLITCKDWADVKDKAKSLKHIIRKCDPPTPTMPFMATGATIPGLYSHIVHSVDKEEGEIPQPFKGAKPKHTRGRGKPKGKPQEQSQNPPKAQEADETYTYDSPNDYYHNDNYNAPDQSRGCRPFNGQGSNQQFRGFTQQNRGQRPQYSQRQFQNYRFQRGAFQQSHTQYGNNEIKKLLISPPVLKAPTPDGLFQLESDTSREGMGGTLLQKQGDEWVVIGYHSKRLPKSAKNFGITELELTGLLVNIHGFMQLLCNRYFEVLVDHKAIEYMIKSKTESPMTRLKTLLLKLREYTIELKY